MIQKNIIQRFFNSLQQQDLFLDTVVFLLPLEQGTALQKFFFFFQQLPALALHLCQFGNGDFLTPEAFIQPCVALL